MENDNTTIAILNLTISFFTPIVIIIIGLLINKKIEQHKIGILKEKEWQVRWAELFLNNAIDLNRSISIIAFTLSRLSNTNNSDSEKNQYKTQLHENMLNILKIDWDIQNYAQFSNNYSHEILYKQKELISKIKEIINSNGGDLEELRKLQFEYNQVVRNAHNEILSIRSKKKY